MDVAPESLEARLQQAALALDAFPSKPPKPSSPRKQVVVTLFDQITRLRKNGYDFNEICELLVETTEVEMTPGTLRKYWGVERRQRQGKKPQHKRSGKPKRNAQKPLHSQEIAEPVKTDEVDEADQKKTVKAPEPSVPVKPAASAIPVTPDEPGKAPPVEDRGADSLPESKSEPPMEQPEPSEDDYWGDDDSQTSGCLNEPTFNRIPSS